MAQDQSGVPAKASWTKIFTAFKIALDIKKLILAAAGIFLVWSGWWLIGWTFYGMRALPKWGDYEDRGWSYFKSKRASWNLIHELAGSPSDYESEDAADVAANEDEFKLLRKWEEAHQRLSKPITLTITDTETTLAGFEVKEWSFKLTTADKKARAELLKLKEKKLTVGSLRDVKEEKEPDKTITEGVKEVKVLGKVVKSLTLEGVKVQVEGPFDKLKAYRDGAMTLEQIEKSADTADAQKAFEKFKTRLVQPRIKPSGLLRITPWHENRGGNPYLIVADTLKTHDAGATGGNLLTWLFSAKALVLLEPLVKFLTPLVYLFDARAGGWDRLYLIFIIVWTLAIWGFFGGAICRIAAVQVARNERISLGEAIAFTRERFVSYVAAPVFPMALLGIFVFVLILFGWVEWIPYLGDLFAGLLWVIVLLIGFMMAIVMVGLIGWPLMVATISTEGTDSFDALSRSYSYVYQAPWQYLWYSFLAVVYGAVLVFFVGFMASLLVFVGKWGVGSAPGLAKADPKDDREPSYLFNSAPTSYGWRDLLISGSPFVEPKAGPDRREGDALDFTAEYKNGITGWNSFGGFLVNCWIYPLFLLVLGFGYSYFWTSSTIVYFLMRNHVDDTEMDEVHLEDDDLDDPFMQATTTPPAPAAAPAGKPGTMSLNIVDAPPAPPPVTSYTADEHAAAPPPAAPVEAPGAAPEPPPAPPAENANPPTDGVEHGDK